jgi:co-chaperonin GroES (HSP10)
MGLNDGKHLERIRQVNDKWILIEYNEDASIAWAGLPFTTRRSDDEESVNKIIVPQSAVERGHDVKEWERVYKVVGMGPRAWTDKDGKAIEQIAVEGDYVIAKGSAPTQIAIDPVMYAIWAENIVCVLNVEVKPRPLKKSFFDTMAEKIGV